MKGKNLKLEEMLVTVNDKIDSLQRRIHDIDEEHSRMFLVSEHIKDKAAVFALQYSSVEESMGYMLTSMRRHDDELRNTNRTISKLESSLYEKIYSTQKEMIKTILDIEKRIDVKAYEIDTKVWFRIRVLEHQIQTNTKESEMLEKIESIVAEIERLKSKMDPKIEKGHAKTWKKVELDEKPKSKYDEQFPNL